MEMNRGNIIQIVLGTRDFITTPAIYQYDHGMALRVSDVTSGEISQAHIGVETLDHSYNLIPIITEEGLEFPIPDVLLIMGKDVFVYLYFEDQHCGYTQCRIQIPVIPRQQPDHVSMDDPYYEQLNSLAIELQRLIDETEQAKQSAEYIAERAEAAAEDAAEASASAWEAVASLENLDPDKIENRFGALQSVLEDFLSVGDDGWYTVLSKLKPISNADIDRICT